MGLDSVRMVYAALPLALVAGGPWQGAAVMLAFGLGTLPNMIALDIAVTKLGGAGPSARRSIVRAWLRPIAGLVIVVFGLSGPGARGADRWRGPSDDQRTCLDLPSLNPRAGARGPHTPRKYHPSE